MKFHRGQPRWDLEKLYAQQQKLQDTLEEKLSAIEWGSGNVEVQWNNIKKSVLDTMSDKIGQLDRKARKVWITQKVINTMDEQRKQKSVNNEDKGKTTEQ
jgi:hypothetical protein